MSSNNATLGAGTFSYWRALGGTEWKRVKGLTSIGQVGQVAPTVDQTVLDDRAARYMAGLYEGPDKTLNGALYPDDVGQQEFIQAAIDGEIIEMIHVWPTTPKTVGKYEMALLGYQIDETTNADKISFVISGKQNGFADWDQPAPEENPEPETAMQTIQNKS